MKKSALSIACICLVAAGWMTACGPSATKQPPEQGAVKPAEQAPAPVQDTTTAAAGKLGDPVCGMPYDTSYHEWSVYKNDTIYFCSPTCKGVFDKNPAKYAAKLGL